MSPEELDRVKDAHSHAILLSEEERQEFLRRTFSGREELLAQALELLEWHDRSGDFLRDPVAPRVFDVAFKGFEDRRVGPYELIRKIGDGGSATVYLARRVDELFEKAVAIKLLNRLALSDDASRRFQREVQSLARIDHPYLIRLFEAGSTGEALSYIVTEYVDGLPIDAYATGLPLEARLRLFLKVCEGVAAAHRTLIVHRDLKPSNILVTAEGTPKILDFGIAVLLDRDSRFTRTGMDRMTVCYASPEQLRGDRAVSTSSDVYSLGVIFYSLICGRVPFDRADYDPPAIPGCPRELQSIARKALQSDVDRRYQSVDRLRDDIERYLSGSPVEAQGDAAAYRLRKFVRKHWLPIAGLCGTFLALAALTTISIASSREAKRQSARVRQVLFESFTNTFFDPSRPMELELNYHIQAARLPFLDALAQDQPGDREVALQRFRAYRKLGNTAGQPSSLNLGKTDEARGAVGKAVEIGERLLSQGGVADDFRRDVAITHIEFGAILLEMDRTDEAQREFTRAAELGGDRVDLESMAQRSRILHLRGRDDEALELRRRVVEERRRLYERDSGIRWEFAGALCSLGELEREMGRLREAETAYAEALPMIGDLAVSDTTFRDNAWHLGRENEEYAKVLAQMGRDAEARVHLERAIEVYRQIRDEAPAAMSNQRALAVCLGLLGTELWKHGNAARGRLLLEEGLRLSEEAARQDPASKRALAERDDMEKARSLAVTAQ